MTALSPDLNALLSRQRERLQEVWNQTGNIGSLRFSPALDRLLLASDYATERLIRSPELLEHLESPEMGALSLALDTPDSWAAALRRYRHAESVRLIYRDINNLDGLEQTLHGSSQLAERCVTAALEAARQSMQALHGTPRNGEGQAQSLVVFALGKLGGAELNFSSDIDLVFAFPESGHSDGRRGLDNDAWFQRLGQRLIQLLAEVNSEGQAYRVDMRLRPFGQVGRLALSFAAMEHYFQREGRDWERYAWIKARPVAGDVQQGQHFLESLRPFVYRRYLDFGAIEGLRDLKTMIEAEVQRRELEDHLKLGRGGIREIEFIIQLQQLIRGGREPVLREQSLMPALECLRQAGHVPEKSAEILLGAYRFLRKLENRLQMLRDEQTHTLPDDPLDQERIALGMGFGDWQALMDGLNEHREGVAQEFSRVFEARKTAPSIPEQTRLAALTQIWQRPDAENVARELVQSGFVEGEILAQRLRAFSQQSTLASLSARARNRLDRIVPQLLLHAAMANDPGAVAERALVLVQSVLRRSSYLALLDERPAALLRLMDVMTASRWMADRLSEHPLLLDELLDSRIDDDALDSASVGKSLVRALASASLDDVEARIHALNEFRQGLAFRIARARVVGQQPARACAWQLANVAEAVVQEVLSIAMQEVARQHGRLAGYGLSIVAYGSFGGRELGFGSDLDLVFLYDEAGSGQESDGPRPLDALRYHTRVVQKVIALLSMQSAAGRLYDADLRLRPDGGKGLLVSSIESFSRYQAERAWTWELQALVRARAVAGHSELRSAFQRIKTQTLCLVRDSDQIAADVVKMRQRMRTELDRSTPERFDLKQGEGGLVDLEFFLQYGVLCRAYQSPVLATVSRTPELIKALAGIGFFSDQDAGHLHAAHEQLLKRSLACTLDRRARCVLPDAVLNAARASIIAQWHQHFGHVPQEPA